MLWKNPKMLEYILNPLNPNLPCPINPFPVLKSFDCETCQDTGEIVAKDPWKSSRSVPHGCPDCCPHDELDHFICLDCSKEFEPSDFYNEDHGLDR